MNDKKVSRRLESSRTVSKIIRAYYQEIHDDKWKDKIVWSGALMPVEILNAMDLMPVFPENYACLCGAKQVSASYCQITEETGYSADLCSYFRTHLGSMEAEDAPYGGLPKPTALYTTKGNCCPQLKWWEVLARKYNLPLFVNDIPPIDEKAQQHQLDYLVSQFSQGIRFLERETGAKMQPERLKKAVQLSGQAGELWEEIADLRKNIPVVCNAPEMYSFMFVMIVYAGTELAVKFMTELKDEMQSIIERKAWSIPNQKYRLLSDGIPFWYNLAFYDYLEELGCVSVVEPYNTHSWRGGLDPSNPLESLAGKYLTFFMNTSLEKRANLMLELAKQYHVDGAVMFSNRTCRLFTIGQLDIASRLEQEFGIPVLIIEADHDDPRLFSAGTVESRTQAFVELLAQ